MNCQLCDTPIGDGYLCFRCIGTVRQALEELPDLYDKLALLLVPGGRSMGGRSGKGGHAPLPLNEDMVDVRAELADVLTSWATAARTDRRALVPSGGVCRVRRACAELLGHLSWAALAWPPAGLMAGEVLQQAAGARSVVGPPEQRAEGMRLGNCPARFEDGVICGAVLRLLPGETVVTCRWCQTVYPDTAWADLKVLMDADRAGAA